MNFNTFTKKKNYNTVYNWIVLCKQTYHFKKGQGRNFDILEIMRAEKQHKNKL